MEIGYRRGETSNLKWQKCTTLAKKTSIAKDEETSIQEMAKTWWTELCRRATSVEHENSFFLNDKFRTFVEKLALKKWMQERKRKNRAWRRPCQKFERDVLVQSTLLVWPPLTADSPICLCVRFYESQEISEVVHVNTPALWTPASCGYFYI